MATLWALTGTLDPRPMQDAKVSDVVNDESKVCVVVVVVVLTKPLPRVFAQCVISIAVGSSFSSWLSQ